ncbi:MAG: KpsF/GutQ family sugar-phosphate isomerase [Kiritimatiellaeota bacterium]|nr:KpsF/GutQ family sugar-phosphate isomerase [Kiritimatiellota bacterium]
MDNAEILARAKQVMEIEIEGLQMARDALGDGFTASMRLILATLEKGGKIVCTGVGKNLHIAEKLSATLASTGSTSVLMNPIQAMHGDLGIVSKHDVLLALSFSGESDEVIRLIPAVRRLGIPVIGMVGGADSSLARLSDVVLCVKIGKEACPFGMAPTTSTTATLAVGDALAMTLLDARQFKVESYARLHPSGAIGRALVLRVRDIMRTGAKVARLPLTATVTEAIVAMTAAKSGAALVTNDDGTLAGIFTDGDLRRQLSTQPPLDRGGPEAGGLQPPFERGWPEAGGLLQAPVSAHMTRSPVSVAADALAVDALRVFETHKIDDLPALEQDGTLAGYVDIQDLPKMKVM